MARPRKDAAGASARARIIEAFWGLLAERAVHELTVGAVVEAAGCNRGTFYYYFADLDALIAAAVREEVLDDDTLAMGVFVALVRGDAAALEERVPRTRMKRVALAIRAGELRTVELAVRQSVQRMWRCRLCAPGEDLDPAASFALQFMVGGMLGYIVMASRSSGVSCPLGRTERTYLARVARTTIDTVAHAQGMTTTEVLARLCAPEGA